MLVKIANNNTGPTVINVNALPSKKVFANTGGDLLPHDVLAGMVVLLVYDGTNFVIQPNPTIVSPVTVNIPSTQFNTPNSFIQALARKTISTNGSVTMQLAAGIYAPINFFHSSSGQITIKGTMIGPAPTLASFSMNGADAATRASDGAFNVAMLRGKYGTEIQVPQTTTGGTGVLVNSGNPNIQDILITCGVHAIGYETYGVQLEACTCINVAVWGCHGGFLSQEKAIVCLNCWAVTCWSGFTSENAGNVQMGTTTGVGNGAIGCDVYGYYASGGSALIANNCYARCNGTYGFAVTDGSTIESTSLDANFNGVTDLYASNQSIIHMNVWVYGTASPSPGFVGNNNAIIVRP
jgi:hypothetical protein